MIVSCRMDDGNYNTCVLLKATEEEISNEVTLTNHLMKTIIP